MKGVGFVREREGLGSASSRSSYPFLYSLVFLKKKKESGTSLEFLSLHFTPFFSFIESEKVGSDLVTNYPYVLIHTWRISVGMDLTVK